MASRGRARTPMIEVDSSWDAENDMERYAENERLLKRREDDDALPPLITKDEARCRRRGGSREKGGRDCGVMDIGIMME